MKKADAAHLIGVTDIRNSRFVKFSRPYFTGYHHCTVHDGSGNHKGIRLRTIAKRVNKSRILTEQLRSLFLYRLGQRQKHFFAALDPLVKVIGFFRKLNIYLFAADNVPGSDCFLEPQP